MMGVPRAASQDADTRTALMRGADVPAVSARRAARAILALGIALGLANLVILPLTRPEQLGLATRVYTIAAEAALAGEPFYQVAPAGLPGYYFVYPPVVMLAMLTYGLLGDAWVAFAVQTVISVAAGLVLARLLVGLVDRAGVELARRDRWLVGGFTLASIHTSPTLVNGQLNLVLGLAIAVGIVALERDRQALAGTTLALAATVKLFPAVLGAYLLRNRAWRAVGAALATGVGLVILGVFVFGPAATETYLTVVLPAESQTGALAADPLAHGFLTVRRQLAALLPWVPAAWLPVLGLLVVAPVVAVTYRRLDTVVDRLLAVLATVIGTLLLLPLEGLYFPLAFVALVPLLYLLPPGRTRTLCLAGTALTLVQVTPASVETMAGLVPGGPALAGAIVGVTHQLFRVILPATVGMWLLLAAGVYWQLAGREAAAGAAGEPGAAGADDSPATGAR